MHRLSLCRLKREVSGGNCVREAAASSRRFAFSARRTGAVQTFQGIDASCCCVYDGQRSQYVVAVGQERATFGQQPPVSSGAEDEPSLPGEAEVACVSDNFGDAPESAESGEEEDSSSSVPEDTGVHRLRSVRRRREPQCWGYGDSFRPMDN